MARRRQSLRHLDLQLQRQAADPTISIDGPYQAFPAIPSVVITPAQPSVETAPDFVSFAHYMKLSQSASGCFEAAHILVGNDEWSEQVKDYVYWEIGERVANFNTRSNTLTIEEAAAQYTDAMTDGLEVTRWPLLVSAAQIPEILENVREFRIIESSATSCPRTIDLTMPESCTIPDVPNLESLRDFVEEQRGILYSQMQTGTPRSTFDEIAFDGDEADSQQLQR